MRTTSKYKIESKFCIWTGKSANSWAATDRTVTLLYHLVWHKRSLSHYKHSWIIEEKSSPIHPQGDPSNCRFHPYRKESSPMKPYYRDVALAYTPHILACGSYQANSPGFSESSQLRFAVLGYLLGVCPPSEAMDSPSLRIGRKDRSGREDHCLALGVVSWERLKRHNNNRTLARIELTALPSNPETIALRLENVGLPLFCAWSEPQIRYTSARKFW